MDNFQRIYRTHPDIYHQMIAAEDVDGFLPATMQEITAWDGKRVLDLGSGSGRLPLLLADQCAQFISLDLHLAMLRQNRQERNNVSGRWSLLQADMRALPIYRSWAGITTAGWAIGHLTSWFADQWQIVITQVLEEMLRVTKPGGDLVIIETLGTGVLKPKPPSPALAQYYTWLESDWGFSRRAIPTDYLFSSLDQAAELGGFFFGPEMAHRIREESWQRLPEWTGVWHRKI